MTNLSDNQIMREVKEGRVEKLAVLFERHHPALFNFFLNLTRNREAAEDLVQEVFIRILKYRKSFQGEGPFTVWLYQIGRNAHVDHLRKKHVHFSLDDQFEEKASPERPHDVSLRMKQEAALIRRALDRLPVKKREILILSRFQDMKYKDLAALFGCRMGTIKAQIHRAIKDLGDIYRELQGGLAP